MGHIEADQLTQSDARGVEKLEDGPIAGSTGIVASRRRQESIDLVYGKVGGEPRRQFRGRNQLRRVCLNHGLAAEVPEERSQGRQFPRDATPRDPIGMQVRDEGPDRQDIDLSQVDGLLPGIPSFDPSVRLRTGLARAKPLFLRNARNC